MKQSREHLEIKCSCRTEIWYGIMVELQSQFCTDESKLGI